MCLEGNTFVYIALWHWPFRQQYDIEFMFSSRSTTALALSSLELLSTQWFSLLYFFGFTPASELYLVFVSSDFHSSCQNHFELQSCLSTYLQLFPAASYQPV